MCNKIKQQKTDRQFSVILFYCSVHMLSRNKTKQNGIDHFYKYSHLMPLHFEWV